MSGAADRRAYLEMLAAYGGKCACCGQDYLPFLSIDHVNGDGALERRIHRGGRDSNVTIAYRARRNNYPPTYQVLCMNCNRAKGTGPACPCNGGTARRTVADELAITPNRKPGGQPGEAGGNVRLTEKDVIYMRRLYADGVPCKDLVDEFGVALSTVYSIIRRYTWKHI